MSWESFELLSLLFQPDSHIINKQMEKTDLVHEPTYMRQLANAAQRLSVVDTSTSEFDSLQQVSVINDNTLPEILNYAAGSLNESMITESNGDDVDGHPDGSLNDSIKESNGDDVDGLPDSSLNNSIKESNGDDGDELPEASVRRMGLATILNINFETGSKEESVEWKPLPKDKNDTDLVDTTFVWISSDNEKGGYWQVYTGNDIDVSKIPCTDGRDFNECARLIRHVTNRKKTTNCVKYIQVTTTSKLAQKIDNTKQFLDVHDILETLIGYRAKQSNESGRGEFAFQSTGLPLFDPEKQLATVSLDTEAARMKFTEKEQEKKRLTIYQYSHMYAKYSFRPLPKSGDIVSICFEDGGVETWHPAEVVNVVGDGNERLWEFRYQVLDDDSTEAENFDITDDTWRIDKLAKNDNNDNDDNEHSLNTFVLKEFNIYMEKVEEKDQAADSISLAHMNAATNNARTGYIDPISQQEGYSKWNSDIQEIKDKSQQTIWFAIHNSQFDTRCIHDWRERLSVNTPNPLNGDNCTIVDTLRMELTGWIRHFPVGSTIYCCLGNLFKIISETCKMYPEFVIKEAPMVATPHDARFDAWMVHEVLRLLIMYGIPFVQHVKQYLLQLDTAAIAELQRRPLSYVLHTCKQCEHGVSQYRCKQCYETWVANGREGDNPSSGICVEHGNNQTLCKECKLAGNGGGSLCDHNTLRSNCVLCKVDPNTSGGRGLCDICYRRTDNCKNFPSNCSSNMRTHMIENVTNKPNLQSSEKDKDIAQSKAEKEAKAREEYFQNNETENQEKMVKLMTSLASLLGTEGVKWQGVENWFKENKTTKTPNGFLPHQWISSTEQTSVWKKSFLQKIANVFNDKKRNNASKLKRVRTLVKQYVDLHGDK